MAGAQILPFAMKEVVRAVPGADTRHAAARRDPGGWRSTQSPCHCRGKTDAMLLAGVGGGGMADNCNIDQLLAGHVVLDLECLDRIYLNAYIPTLQVGGQVVTFLTRCLGFPIPSPALFGKLGDRFRKAVRDYATRCGIPLIDFKPKTAGQEHRKLEVMRPYFEAARLPGVVAIGVAQEFQSVFVGRDRATKPGAVNFGFGKADRRVTCYYFYILDAEFGPSFVKLCAYFPYPGKVWVNGHEWAKRQAQAEQLRFTELANGFASCQDPEHLQAICDRLGPAQIEEFFERWMTQLPLPLGAEERRFGYWWELSMRQIETSRTLVLDAPRRARGFFESLITDNLDLGRPDQVQLIFGRQVRKNTLGIFSTRLVNHDTEVTINFFYRHSRIKEYLKEGRALRVELVCNSPDDLGCQRRLRHLPELQEKARAANYRLLTMQRVGQGCAISTALFERIALPSIQEGQRTGALRFGDKRAMALADALCATVHALGGFTNRSLRARVASLLGTDYRASQMTYDLRRLRNKGLIRRLPHSQLYVLNHDGLLFAFFFTKLRNRLLVPLLAADQTPAPLPLRQALRVIDRTVDDYITAARIAA
ncbi:MAG: hypothetical protein ACRENM_02380 [Candidatus Dormibacteraceae bacterium]